MNYQAIIDKSESIFGKLQNYRRTIHKNPELSFREFETSKFIQAKLDELGISYEILAETGIVAMIGKGDKCVALRADIDALPVVEETGYDFASSNNGIMHACGHDMHTTMLLGAAEILNSHEGELHGCVKLIFQPGEEKLPGGASVMIKEGVLKNPKPLAIFGQHVFPEAETGTISIGPGFIMASADEIYWTLKGKGSHAAQPQIGNDPILAAAHLIQYYQSIMVKRRDPLMPGVLSVTSVNGGSATNIFPDEVEMRGTMRSFDQAWREMMHNLIHNQSSALCSLYDVFCELIIVKGYPPLFNHPETVTFTINTAKSIFGEDYTFDFIPKMWAEDFSYYSQEIPATFWFLGVKPEGMTEMYPLHNSKFAPDESAMIKGTAQLAAIAIDYLKKH